MSFSSPDILIDSSETNFSRISENAVSSNVPVMEISEIVFAASLLTSEISSAESRDPSLIRGEAVISI